MYVFGGSQDPSAAENWNASTGSWTSLAPMPTIVRALEASCVQTGEICALGWASDDYVVHVEVFQPWVDSWSTRTSMPIPSSIFSLVAYNSRLYILQGPGENTYVYDPRNSAPALHFLLGNPLFGVFRFVICTFERALNLNMFYPPLTILCFLFAKSGA